MPKALAVLKRHTDHYVVLAVLVAIALAYQTRVAAYQYPGWFGQPTDVNGVVVSVLTQEARAAGAHDADQLLSVNGKRVTGIAVFGEAIARAHAGDVLQVTLRSRAGGTPQPEHTVRIKLLDRGQRGVFSLIFFVVMPFFCLLLGLRVAAVRPRDPLAWLLLALMLSFTSFPYPGTETWGPVWHDLGEIYRIGLNTTWPLWMFGIYFPEPFPPDLRSRWWEWCKWVIGAPLALVTVPNMTEGVGELENLASVMPPGTLGYLCEHFGLLTLLCRRRSFLRIAWNEDGHGRLDGREKAPSPAVQRRLCQLDSPLCPRHHCSLQARYY